MANLRNDLFSWMTQKGWKFTKAQSNCFMVDVGRPSEQVIDAMAAKKVIIGRKFPTWPTQVRVSIGTREEMAIFKKAFAEVMGA